ncbi:MAG: NAD+ synthase [Chitinispirillaceae bacterium]|nr:NAD+ synthase [Chitinispirillaceae bacterium]
MKITICQLNPLVGDVAGNARRVCDAAAAASKEKADLVVFPELFIQGYPPRDLLEQRWFLRSSQKALESVAACSKRFPSTGILAGSVLPSGLPRGRRLYNAAVLIIDGAIKFSQPKTLLPVYDVFDETRYFDPARKVKAFGFKGERLGISICEDAWNHEELWTGRLYERDPVAELAEGGATLFINIAASPFHMGKENLRASLARKHAKRHAVPFLYVNQVGGNDELVFDGNSMFFDAKGVLRVHCPAFTEAVVAIDTEAGGKPLSLPDFDTEGAVYGALVLGVSDYAKKCGFSKALIGLSGGVDSALTAALAAKALGPENVWGVALPSRYSSEGSVNDARKLAENLGIEFSVISIEKPFAAFLETLAPSFEGTVRGIAEENLQARVRGTLLMALSNKFGHLLLSTGNKSELAVGYCTLYGDMNGGLGVLSDLTKEMVYRLARFVNTSAGHEVIPSSTLEKPPSAELRPNQTDQDTLPPYPVLDAILEGIVGKGASAGELIEQGFEAKTVKWVCGAIAGSEYKRRQAAPGLKVTPKAFGMGRRFPIAAKYDW